MNQDQLKKEQLKLAKKLLIKDQIEELNLIAGFSQIYHKNKMYSGVVVIDKNFKIIEEKYASSTKTIPYIPGFLCFREGPAILEAFNKLENKPDLIMIKGHGIIHQRLGLASYIGVILGLPVIGIANKLLYGEIKNNKIYIDGKLKGYELKTKEHGNPIYISPGNKITVTKSLELVKQFIKSPHKLPEPLFLAQKYIKKVIRELS